MKSFRIKGEESILSKDFKSKTIKMVPAERKHKNQVLLLDPSKVPLTSICAEDCERLQRLRKRLGYPDLYVRISRSKVKKDDRGLYVPDFSARGPSPLYEDTIVPDVVAPGYAILSSFPSDKSIFLSDKGKRCYNDQRIASGTSMAAPHVAAQIAEIWSHRPIWGPSILKSAAITTARSLSAEGIPGNEFAFGAGLIQVDKAIDPGLVYEESDANFERYRKRSLSVYHLNLPSFAASFGTSSDYVERVFHRNLTNIGDGSANYKFEVQLINNTLDPNVSIEVFPKELKFLPRQNHMYTIVVKVIPRPGGSYSGLLKWVHQIDNDQTVRRHDVCSPIISYHKSAYPYIVS